VAGVCKQSVDETEAGEDSADRRRFAIVAKLLAHYAGSPWAMAVALVAVLAWMAVGARIGYSRAWELAMTAGLPMVTLLLLIVVQHTQNHDNLALQLKLDELIRAHEGAEDQMIRVEDASREHLEQVEGEFKAHVDDDGGRSAA
jgi:low affinity Fe/Cu permease